MSKNLYGQISKCAPPFKRTEIVSGYSPFNEKTSTGSHCDKKSEVICVLFILIIIVSKVIDPMTGLTIISICSSSAYSPLIVYPSLSLLFRFVYKGVFYVK